MFKLVVLAVHDFKSGMLDKEARGNFDFETSNQAELRALLWLMYCPNDIVMLVEVEEGVCRFCRKPIEEKVGWVRHRWVHKDGGYTCWNNALTQAEPLEEGMV